MKKLFISILVLFLAAAAGGMYWLHSNLGGVAKAALQTQGSAMLQVPVQVGGVDIRPADGLGAIHELVVGNPPGFKTPHAIKVQHIELGVDLRSLTKDVVVIHKVVVDAPDIIYEKGDGITNFDALQRNVAASLGPAKHDKSSAGKKFVVESFVLRNARAHASAALMQGKTVAITLPDIHLKDLGKSKGGLSAAELGQEIASAMQQKLAAAYSFDSLLKSAGQALDKAGQTIKGWFGK